MKRLDGKRTNQAAIEQCIALARGALTGCMPHRASGEWQVIVRWTNGIIDHLEPQRFGNDQPSESTGCFGPTADDMRRIERAITAVAQQASAGHPFGRASLKICWEQGRVSKIDYAICESHKVEPASSPA